MEPPSCEPPSLLANGGEGNAAMVDSTIGTSAALQELARQLEDAEHEIAMGHVNALRLIAAQVEALCEREVELTALRKENNDLRTGAHVSSSLTTHSFRMDSTPTSASELGDSNLRESGRTPEADGSLGLPASIQVRRLSIQRAICADTPSNGRKGTQIGAHLPGQVAGTTTFDNARFGGGADHEVESSKSDSVMSTPPPEPADSDLESTRSASGEDKKEGRDSVRGSRVSVTGIPRRTSVAAGTCLEAPEEQKRYSRREEAKRLQILAVAMQHMPSRQPSVAKVPFLQRYVKSTRFDMCSVTLLGFYALLVGLQVDFKVSRETGQLPLWMDILDCIFSFCFLIELILRLVTDGPRRFYTSYNEQTEWGWNWFDTFVVIVGVGDTVFSFLLQQTGGVLANVAIFRTVRIARAVRTVRIIRMMRFLRPLRVLTAGILATLKDCVWALLLLWAIIYVFSLIITQYVADYLADNSGENGKSMTELRFYYGTFLTTMFTLFKSIVGGVDWQDAVLPLGEVSDACVFLFLVYISFVCFAVLNVMTGIFVSSAVEQAEQEKECMIQQQLQEKERYTKTLLQLFDEIDDAQDGLITLQEFETNLQKESVQSWFQKLDIETTDAWTLFKLLDADGKGVINPEAFVEGCLQLKGNAKGIHVAQIMYENKWIMEKLEEIAGNWEKQHAQQARISKMIDAEGGRGGSTLFPNRPSMLLN